MVDEALERGRSAYATGAWADAHAALAQADASTQLSAADLERLARAEYLLGRDEEYQQGLERAFHAHQADGEPLRAARCAFWIGLNLAPRGEMSRASGWFARAQRLVDDAAVDCVERGYLLVPVLFGHLGAGDHAAAYATATEAVEIGERFGDADLVALLRQEQGHALIRQGKVQDGLRLVDEVMVAVTGGELSPVITGILYCNNVAFCRDNFELRRCREWTASLTQWCDRNDQMVAHTGVCLVHRAEIMTMQGAWTAAVEEATRACERLARGVLNEVAVGHGHYAQGEVHRLRGDVSAAEAAYAAASAAGREPLPGLALLRLTQGNTDAALAALRRALGETTQQLPRARLLPAYVEVLIASGTLDEAVDAAQELAATAAGRGNDELDALSAQTLGALALAQGDAQGDAQADAQDALPPLRRACQIWHDVEAPYAVARVRELIGVACRRLGDEDTAVLELSAARVTYTTLGAVPDERRAAALLHDEVTDPRGLTARELEVLRLVAGGATNKAIASELVLSERTVDRHVSNIFLKLQVNSRAAATAYAYEHRLV